MYCMYNRLLNNLHILSLLHPLFLFVMLSRSIFCSDSIIVVYLIYVQAGANAGQREEFCQAVGPSVSSYAYLILFVWVGFLSNYSKIYAYDRFNHVKQLVHRVQFQATAIE